MGLLLNKNQVLTGELNLCLDGVWYADLRLNVSDSSFKAGDSVTLKTEDEKLSLAGTVAPDRVGEVLSVVYLRVIGGKGGLAKQASAKAFQNGLVNDVLSSLVNDAGESLSNTISQSVLNTQLANWTIFQAPIAYQLNILTKAFNWNWRFLGDGTLWVGEESWPNADKFDYTLLDYDPINGYTPLAVSSPVLLPGYNLDGYKASRVVHELNMDSVRTKLYQPQTSGDRSILSATKAVINSSLSPIDFFAQYSAAVDSQASDGSTVDITPDDSRLPGMQKIPFSCTLPGTTVNFSGGKVWLGWSGGDPTKPYAIMQSNSGETVSKMVIKAGNITVTMNNGAMDVS